MHLAPALDSRALALELHDLLRDLDPSRWRDELARVARPRLLALERQVRALLATPWTDLGRGRLRARLDHLAALLAERMPEGDRRRDWMAYRKLLSRAYDGIARALRAAAIHVPSLRATNYARSALHVGSAVAALVLVEAVIPAALLVPVAFALAATAWSFEISRRMSPRVNELLMWVFGPVAHPHEAHRVNSSTWYATALLALALLGTPAVVAVALAVLGVGDPAAGLVGRRFGRVRLVHGKSLEGSAAFVAAGLLAAATALAVFHPALGGAAIVVLAAAGALPGALAELFVRRVDDNLTVPLAAAGGALLAASVLGLL